jgi:2-methylcitrate dehydratase PrpD
VNDAAANLWADATEVARTAGPEALERTARCAAAAIAEMLVAGRDPRWRQAADRLAEDIGPARLVGRDDGRSSVEGATAANALLLHANLADDTYLTAAHPGVMIVPPALALADSSPASIDGGIWLRALIAGYEVAGAMASTLIPDASRAGWRVTAAIAPLAAATVTAMLGPDPARGPAALRLAAATAGGVLSVFDQGDAWRLQPAIAAVQGVQAARAAAGGLDGSPETIDGEGGIIEMLTSGRRLSGAADRPVVMGLTFKRFPVPMYGQAICAAIEGSGLSGEISSMTVTVPEFATAYAAQGADSVTSIAGIAARALSDLPDPVIGPRADAIEVRGCDDVGPHGALVDIEMADGSSHSLQGDGDTSDWGAPMFDRHYARLLGDECGRRMSGLAADLVESRFVSPALDVALAP